MLTLGQLLVAAPIVLTLQQVDQVEEPDQVMQPLARAIEARTGRPVLLTAEGPSNPTDRVDVRLLGGPTRIRLVVARATLGGARFRESSYDLTRGSRDGWTRAFVAVADELFPERSPSSQAITQVVPPAAPESSGPALGPWLLLGGGAAAAVAGCILAIVHQNAAASLREQQYPPEELGRRIAAYETSGQAAVITLVGAGVSLSAGFIWAMAAD